MSNLTASDVARMGAKAQQKKYGKRQLKAWGKMGGRPRKLDKKAKRTPSR